MKRGIKVTIEQPGYAFYVSNKCRLQLNLDPAYWIIIPWRATSKGWRAGILCVGVYFNDD